MLGRKKVEQAKLQGVPLLDESQFFELIETGKMPSYEAFHGISRESQAP